MSKQPARLYPKQDNTSPLIMDYGWILLHPVTILITLLIIGILCSALVFAISGGSAVESGGMRNFLASGV